MNFLCKQPNTRANSYVSFQSFFFEWSQPNDFLCKNQTREPIAMLAFNIFSSNDPNQITFFFNVKTQHESQ